MSRKRGRTQTIKSSLTFGGLAAETDHLLEQAYLDNGDYETIGSRLERRCFVIGRTGSGKSAAFAQLKREHSAHVISIEPENLSLPYLTNLDAIRQLMDLNVHLEPFLVALWKHVILVEVLKHRYHITSPEAKRSFLHQMKERLQKDPAKMRAVQYLDEFGDKFWCDTDERVRQIAETLSEKLVAAGDLKVGIHGIGVGAKVENEQLYTQEVRQEQAARYQRIVNETQLPRLNEMIVVLHEEVLDSEQHFTYLLVDDLDKEWVDQNLVNLLIRCLFQAVRDMIRVKHLKILVALRTNIFRQLDYGGQHQGGQEEKFRGMIIPLHWTRHDLRALLEQRAEAASGFYGINPPVSLPELLPNTNKHRGDPLDHLLDRTLMRPRDAILFLNAVVREAAGKRSVSWSDIHSAEIEYSRERLDALRDEWKNPFPGIERVLEQFRGRKARLDWRELTKVFDDIVTLPADTNFPGTVWLTELSAGIWEAGAGSRSWDEMYGMLVYLLYEISFLGLVEGERTVYSYETTSPASMNTSIEGRTFEIHPAFRLGLQMSENHRLKKA